MHESEINSLSGNVRELINRTMTFHRRLTYKLPTCVRAVTLKQREVIAFVNIIIIIGASKVIVIS